MSHPPTEGTCPVQIPRTTGGWDTCDRPLQGGTTCPPCWSDLHARARDAESLLPVLLAIARREESTRTGGGHGVPGPRLPLDLNAWAAHDALTDALNIALTTPRTAPTAAGILTWVDGVITHARTITDPTPARLRPTCPDCGERVPIPPDPHDGQTLPDGRPIRCPGCVTITCTGWIHDPDGHPMSRCSATGNRAWWAAHAGTQEEHVTITRLQEVLLAWGHDLPRRRIQDWADRRLIVPAGHDGRGRLVYDPVAVALIAGRMAAKRRAVRRTTA